MNPGSTLLHAAARRAQASLSGVARHAWPLIQKYNTRFERPAARPKWAPAPLLKRRERTFPQLGWPRETDSLCPKCVKEIRTQILCGERDLSTLIEGKPGEVRARIVQQGGKVVMTKTCDVHGRFEDVMAIDPAFLDRIEKLYPGRDFLAPLTRLREHGSSSVKYGRGSVLTVDLTNRCNMMCDPCFMDANQVGFVHELEWEEITKILDDSLTIQPRRQMSVQFSGGEPTLSPHFLRAVAYAIEKGYFCVQAATNGIRFAEDREFAKQAKAAGMRLAYLQFDGVTNLANSHRKVGNLFDVKLRAIENLHAAGIDVVLVVTVVGGVNDAQVGPIIDFAVANADKITVVSFQPVSFTGRDEDVADDVRATQRYTLSHLAHDVKKQTGATEPLRDWFPLSALGPFSDLTDTLMGERSDWGALKCGCHPNCGIGTVLFVHKKTKRMVPLTEFLDLEQLLHDVQDITDGAQARGVSLLQLAVALAKNFDAAKAPPGFTILPPASPVPQPDGQPRDEGGRVRRRRRRVRVARAVRRRDVVPGPLQLRLPAHGDVHHPLRDADGRDQLLRVQHGRRLAEHHREDEGERHGRRVVPGEGPARRLREEPGPPAPGRAGHDPDAPVGAPHAGAG